MKQLIAILIAVFSASLLSAQDVITLRNGEAINGKVAEVGVNEIKYYKSSNISGPVYVTGKAEVSHIVYANGSKDVFSDAQPSTQQSAVAPSGNIVSAPQTYRARKPVRRYRPYLAYQVIVPHIDLGHHVDIGHHENYSSHHGGRHH
ncbi:hypothetical protein SAMN05444008_12041 [Cnuella takakiae]|uniref:Uncharacterized protein n=1 Tax=Cnuella takakiae TaxID=1302690 RepID=A0A1M5HSJ9_9BACT|nr:hypothetical protein [Cnuella takakiae]OLY95660.1 hypothetical protein BUE76_00105 [Cnuella takakiae]SHG18941.1 hypothetical protein SAMN05444008_12041 [Cnuella takakiae]